jgi:O-methyltransferase domain/Dimerisation domain
MTSMHDNRPAVCEPFGSKEDTARMAEMITGYEVSQIVSVAAAHSLPEFMSDGPVAAEDIAAAKSLNADATFRFMRACASIGLMTHDTRTDMFTATSLLRTLSKANPQSLGSRAQVYTLEPFWLAFGRFSESLGTGRPQAMDAAGCNLWTYLEKRPEKQAIFADAMKGFAPSFGADAIQLVDTSSVSTVVDVGGASGGFVHALMQQNPSLRGMVFDLPFVVPLAEESARIHGLKDRFSTISGDFLSDDLPSADLFLLRSILHDWDDDSCLTILRNCRTSINAGGRLIIAEVLVGTRGDSGPGPLLDLLMMVGLGGKERSAEQYATLLAASGFRMTSVLPTSTEFSLIKAEPV